jgi:hypothetical protein
MAGVRQLQEAVASAKSVHDFRLKFHEGKASAYLVHHCICMYNGH